MTLAYTIAHHFSFLEVPLAIITGYAVFLAPFKIIRSLDITVLNVFGPDCETLWWRVANNSTEARRLQNLSLGEHITYDKDVSSKIRV